MNIMMWVWLAVGVVFVVVEIATTGLVSIWFAGGALAALLAALAGAGWEVQLVLFAVVSAVLLGVTRPLVRKFTREGKVPTNADRVLGMEARVSEEIDNLAGTGAVYVDGKTWTARSEDEETIPAGEIVRVRKMEGVKLFVARIKCEVKKGE